MSNFKNQGGQCPPSIANVNALNFSKLVFSQIPVILTFFNIRDLYSRCAEHTQSNS